MHFLIVTPTSKAIQTGNRNTAQQWAELLRNLGHTATVAAEHGGRDADALIALNATRTHPEIVAFHKDHPGKSVVVALTGSDLYPELGDDSLDSLRIANRIVVLQPGARDRVPEALRDRVCVIVQSATAPPTKPARSTDAFEVCVVGHLRTVKDPMLAAAAARLLPAESRIRIRHAGAILEDDYRERVAQEQRDNPRYTWLGEVDPGAAQELMARCRLQVLSSIAEGGARVIGESLVAGTPVLAARNDATRSLLGDDYAGLFDAGRTEQLRDLMHRAETDAAFLDLLHEQADRRTEQFQPAHERNAWHDLVAKLDAADRQSASA
ncbi:MAG: selenoneine biosynthesis selenosugar synthase SenB [Planctomycetota bacterium]